MIQEGTYLTIDDLEARVRRGARFMDLTDPDWYVPGHLIPDQSEDFGIVHGYELEDGEGIDLSQFDLSSCERCVLGQRMSTYSEAIDNWNRAFRETFVGNRLTFFDIEIAYMLPRARRLGFDIPERGVLSPGEDPTTLMPLTIDRGVLYQVMSVLWECEIMERRQVSVDT